MKRTTVFIDESLLARIQQVARADGRSFASIVREALLAHLAARNAANPGRLPSITGMFASGLQDGAERVEDLVGAGSGRVSVVAHAGALYALIDRSDSWHALIKAWWVVARERVMIPSLVLPVVAQAVSRRLGPKAEAALIRSVVDGELHVESADRADLVRSIELVETYQYLPLSFVDASVVAMAERLGSTAILTTERNRFAAVRPAHAEKFRLLP